MQDHNYGAPPPLNVNEPGFPGQCKQESCESKSTNIPIVSVPGTQRSGLKTFTPHGATSNSQPGKTIKLNGHTPTVVKRQHPAGSSIGNGAGYPNDSTPSSPVTLKNHSALITPPLLSKTALNLPCAGDLNSHLYASVTTEQHAGKEDLKGSVSGNGSRLSGFLGGWFRYNERGERVRSRSDILDSFNDDSNESIDNSPRMATESDREGEETETAPECEGEEDYDERNHEESVTRCIW